MRWLCLSSMLARFAAGAVARRGMAAHAHAHAHAARRAFATSLPQGWVEFVSEDGTPYYHHAATAQTSWELPVTAGAGAATPAATPAATSATANPAATPLLSPEVLEGLQQVEQKVIWLSTYMIHHANNLRPSADGLKVGGHQASSTSLATLLVYLYMRSMAPQDRCAVKPHAGPVFHAIRCEQCPTITAAPNARALLALAHSIALQLLVSLPSSFFPSLPA